MKKLDRFIITAFVGPFFAILVVVVFILMMQFLWLYIDELVGKGLGIRVVLEFLMWGACTILPLALPLSTLLAAMMTLGQMSENNELMAIKSSGTSLSRVIRPLAVVAVLISIAAFYAGNNLVPMAFNAIYTMRDDIKRTKNEIKIPAGTFYNGIDGYVLRVESQEGSGMMHKVMVYDHTSGKGNTSLTLADSAIIKMSPGKDYLIFTLYDGVNYQETNTRRYRDTTLELQHMDFRRQELVIPLSNYSFQKSDTSRFGDQVKAMQVKQLAYQKDSLYAQATMQADGQYRQLVNNSYFKHKDELDTSKVASRERYTTLFSVPGGMKWRNVPEKARALENAVAEADRFRNVMNSYAAEVHEYYYYLRRTDIEFMKKFAQALACLMLFFIGAPLGALTRKGGVGVGVLVAILFFVLYWVVDISGIKLAKDAAVTAPIGTFLSAAVLIPIGAYLTTKAIKDASFFEGDSIKLFWRSLKSRAGRILRKPRIVFMGTPEFAVASLDALVYARYKVCGVVTVADKPSGRGQQMHESAVKQYAVAHGIPVLQPVRLKDPAFLSELAAWKADLFVVVAFRMLPEEVWSMPRLGTFNLHAALLPQYRGAAPVNWAVMNGERITGVTTFMIDKDIDTGGIIFRQEYRIGREETAGDVHDALMKIGAGLVVESTEAILRRSVEVRVQRSFIQGSEVLRPAPKLTKENTRIDWTRTSAGIYNFVRGLSPYPCAWTVLSRDGEQKECKLFFVSDAGSSSRGGRAPGTLFLEEGKLFCATGDGAVEILEIQLAGKKRMPAADFVRGFRDIESYKAG